MARKTMPVTGSGGYRGLSWHLLIPYAPPWIGWLVLPALAFGARKLWATSISSAMGAAVGVVLLVVGLTMFTWHVFRARGHSIRVHATASVGAGGGWLLIALVAGLDTRLVWSIWGMGGFGVCLAWSLRRLAKSDGGDHHADDGGQKVLEAVGLKGARFGKPKIVGGKVSATLQLVGGEHTTADAQAAKSKLESKMKLRPGAVRIISNPDREDTPMVEIVAKDPLVYPIPWKGPNAPGESIAEIVEFATYDDGTRGGIYLPGRAKPVRPGGHYKVAGTTGSGKTEGGLIVITNTLTRTDASVIYVDSVKGIQSIAPIINGVDLPILDRAKAMKFLKSLQTVIRDRTEFLGQRGFKQWEPGCGLKYLIVQIEEAADLLADSATFVKTSEQARSAGITLIPSMQRWSHDRVDTSVRENINGSMCYGVSSDTSATMALSEDTLDAGAEPWRWKNFKPGYLYIEGPGIDPKMWPRPARADLAESGHLTAAVAEFAHPGLDHVTAMALGDLYADHVSLVAEGRAPWQKPPVTATKMPVKPAPVDEDEIDDDDGDEVETDYEHELPAQPEPGFMDDIDPDTEIGDDDDNVIAISIPVSPSTMGRTEAVDALRSELRSRADAGMETIRPSELVEFRQRVGRSASWLTQELQRLVDEEFLSEEPDRGVYGLPVPVPV